jgi:hypothetical protein
LHRKTNLRHVLMTIPTSSITIRPAYADDHAALVRLAALDSAPIPPMPLLIAEVDGEVRAALSQRNGTAIANPFFPTRHLLELLALHGDGTSSAHQRRLGRRSAWLRALTPRVS